MILSIRAICVSPSIGSCALAIGWQVSAVSVATSPSAVQLDGSSAAYARAAVQLLPPGRAWVARPGSLLARLCDGLSREFARIGQAIDDVLALVAPSSAAPWVRIFDRDPIAQPPISGSITFAALVAALPSEWAGVSLTYREEPREPTRSGVARAGDHLRGETSVFSLWLVVTPATPSFSSHQLETLLAEVTRIAAAMLPPTAALAVEIEGV